MTRRRSEQEGSHVAAASRSLSLISRLIHWAKSYLRRRTLKMVSMPEPTKVALPDSPLKEKLQLPEQAEEEILSPDLSHTVTNNLHQLLAIPFETIPDVSAELSAEDILVASAIITSDAMPKPTMAIKLGRKYLESLPPNVRRQEAEGIIYNQLAHLLLSAKEMPDWLRSGASDWVRLKLGKQSPGWHREIGGNYEEGWSRTAYFLQWLDGDERLPLAWRLSELGSKGLLTNGVDVQALWKEYQKHLLVSSGAKTSTLLPRRPSEPTFILIDDNKASETFFAALPNALEFLLKAYLTTTGQLYPTSEYPAKEVSAVTLVLSNTYHGVAVTDGNTITLSTLYVNGFASGHKLPETTHELKGVLVHEMVHVVQYDGVGKTPGGLIEGVADFCRLRANLGAAHWRRQPGGEWDSGYERTGYFLDWVEKEKSEGFVARCNAAMREPWNAHWAKEDCGESWEELWKAYQDYLKDEETDKSS